MPSDCVRDGSGHAFWGLLELGLGIDTTGTKLTKYTLRYFHWWCAVQVGRWAMIYVCFKSCCFRSRFSWLRHQSLKFRTLALWWHQWKTSQAGGSGTINTIMSWWSVKGLGRSHSLSFPFRSVLSAIGTQRGNPACLPDILIVFWFVPGCWFVLTRCHCGDANLHWRSIQSKRWCCNGDWYYNNNLSFSILKCEINCCVQGCRASFCMSVLDERWGCLAIKDVHFERVYGCARLPISESPFYLVAGRESFWVVQLLLTYLLLIVYFNFIFIIISIFRLFIVFIIII